MPDYTYVLQLADPAAEVPDDALGMIGVRLGARPLDDPGHWTVRVAADSEAEAREHLAAQIASLAGSVPELEILAHRD